MDLALAYCSMPALPRPPNAVTWQKPRHGQKLAGYKKKGGMRRSEKVGREISKELWRGGRDWGVKSSSRLVGVGDLLMMGDVIDWLLFAVSML